jgi:hypothetical protein
MALAVVSYWDTSLRVALWHGSGAAMGAGLGLHIKRPLYGTLLGILAAAIILVFFWLVTWLF